MNNLSLEELKTIIETGDFEALSNRIENEFCECKRGIYLLEADSGKRELAKDVASFANLNGGYILIGPQTERNEQHLGDEIKSISYLQEGQINRKQYFDIIREWIYPDIQGLDIFWRQGKIDSSKGIFIIHIPNQTETTKPFLIKKVLDEKKKVEIVFGYVERRRDGNIPKDISSIYALLRDGINYNRNIDGRFSKLESLLDGLKTKEMLSKNENIYTEIQQRAKKSLNDNKMDNLPNFGLVVYPTEPVNLKTVFLKAENSLMRKLENPPEFRYAGWDLGTLDQAQIREGKFVRVRNGERKIIDLYEDGSLVFCALANDEFLAWGSTQGSFKLNSLALIESISNFCNFYSEVLEDFNYVTGNLCFCFSFNNLWIDDKKYFLVPYAVGTCGFSFGGDKQEAHESSIFSEPIVIDAINFRAELVAYQIVEKIYLWFGFSTDKIPYKKNDNGNNVIDFEKIKTIR